MMLFHNNEISEEFEVQDRVQAGESFWKEDCWTIRKTLIFGVGFDIPLQVLEGCQLVLPFFFCWCGIACLPERLCNLHIERCIQMHSDI